MISAQKEQTAFRFDPWMLTMMKRRAKSLNLSLNSYVTKVISTDLIQSEQFPEVSLKPETGEKAMKYAGIFRMPEVRDFEDDERFNAIWNR